MATRTFAALADGQLPSSKGTIYTVPASTIVLPTLLVMVQTSATPQTIEIWLNKTGASRRYLRIEGVVQYDRIELHFAGEVLEAGDLVEAASTTANVVDYTLSGVKET